MMNHTVPDFESDEDFAIPKLPMKSTMGENGDIMELLWQNGEVVMRSQNQRSIGNTKPETRPATTDFRSSTVGEDETRPSDMLMQEDEMATWLHHPIDDVSLENYIYGNDIINPPITAGPASLPPLPPPSVMIPSRPPAEFRHVKIESGQHNGSHALQTATIIVSNETALVKDSDSQASHVSDRRGSNYAGNIRGGTSTHNTGKESTSSLGWDMVTYEMSVPPSSNSCDSGGATMEPHNDQKRNRRDINNAHRNSEDVEFENDDAQKQSQGGSTSTKRSRAAEVHNLSERRRRDRINEKMKELQDLIPQCNKPDKASMLDEAIEYTKSLKMQVKMMSMGCHMVPMMFPGVQQLMQPMGTGLGMGPYPTNLPSSLLPNPDATTAHLGQNFPFPGFNMSPATIEGCIHAANMSDPMMNPLTLNSQNQPRVPNFADPFQQYLGFHQTQLPLPQNQGGVPSNEIKPSSSKDATNPDGHQTGHLPNKKLSFTQMSLVNRVDDT